MRSTGRSSGFERTARSRKAMINACPLCNQPIAPGDGAAAFRGRVAHIACWLEWRGGHRAAPRPSVLVVDDDPGTRYATRRVLENAQFDVIDAADAATALQAVERRPDLILLDLQLPDLDGIEVCRRIKSDPAMASVRVLPFTGVFTNEGDRRRAFDAGADGYLVKPIPPDQLIATLNGLIGIG
jgi:CheY-like chemotaxis protein